MSERLLRQERRFALALAAQAAQALQRAQLQRRRFEAARDLEHSLMPPRGLEAALVEADGDASGIASAVEAAVLGHTSSVLTDDMAALVLRIPRS